MTNDSTRQLYESKQGFLIFDICNVFPFFKMNPDGKKDASDSALSLYQKIFMQKVSLYKAMQTNYSSLCVEDRKFYESLREELEGEVKRLNRNYIGVIKNLETVDKFSEEDAWINLTQTEFTDIKKKVAPNVTGEIDLEESRAFDYLCFKFAATRFNPNNDFKKVAKTIYVLSRYLSDVKGHITEVAAHKETLDYVASDEFIKSSTITKVNDCRQELRELMKYIDRKDFKPIISDFDDEITTFTDAIEDPVDFTVTIDDFKTLEEKVVFFIHSNPEVRLVKEIQNLIKPSADAIAKFKKEVIKIAKTAEEYNELFKEDEDIVTFVRKNVEFLPSAVDAFLDKEKNKGLNEDQLKYIKELLLFISQNGDFKRQYLLRPELLFGELFNSSQINDLIVDIEKII